MDIFQPECLNETEMPGAGRKSFGALARRCCEAQHLFQSTLIDVCSAAKIIHFAAEGLRLALSVDRNCGIRVQ
jgi:hypothetical protein